MTRVIQSWDIRSTLDMNELYAIFPPREKIIKNTGDGVHLNRLNG